MTDYPGPTPDDLDAIALQDARDDSEPPEHILDALEAHAATVHREPTRFGDLFGSHAAELDAQHDREAGRHHVRRSDEPAVSWEDAVHRGSIHAAGRAFDWRDGRHEEFEDDADREAYPDWRDRYDRREEWKGER